MKKITSLTKPPDSGTPFRVYAESPDNNLCIFELDSHSHQQVWDLLCNLSSPARASPEKEQGRVSGGNPERVEKIIRYMETHLDRKISLDQVAEHIGMSRKGLSSFCSRHLPGGFSIFLNTLRLNRASDLLLSTPDTILYISLCCGFESISHFNLQFKKRFGVNPSGFRKGVGA